jgi:hypothetical protein
MLTFRGFQRSFRGGFLTLGGMFGVAVLMLWSARLGAQDAGKSGTIVGKIPARIQGRWPNDARDTFWYHDYETAARVARESKRPIFLVINRGATCEV